MDATSHTKAKLQLLALAGFTSASLALWWWYSQRTCQDRAAGDDNEIPLEDRRKAKRRAPLQNQAALHQQQEEEEQEREKEEALCECGKKVSEGGCPPGYSKKLLGTVKKYVLSLTFLCPSIIQIMISLPHCPNYSEKISSLQDFGSHSLAPRAVNTDALSLAHTQHNPGMKSI